LVRKEVVVNDKIYICDSLDDNKIINNEGLILCTWNSSSVDMNAISIASVVYSNEKEIGVLIRQRIEKFWAEESNLLTGDPKFHEYIYFNVLNEKSNLYRTESLNETIKLIGLDFWLKKCKFKEARLSIEDRNLAFAIQRILENNGVTCQLVSKSFELTKPWLIISRGLFGFVAHVIANLPLALAPKRSFFLSKPQKLWAGYSEGLFYENGVIRNRFNHRLNDSAGGMAFSSVFLYTRGTLVRNVFSALRVQFKSSNNLIFIESLMSFSIVMKTLKSFASLALPILMKRGKMKDLFMHYPELIPVANDFFRSIYGFPALWNIYYKFLFSKMIGGVPTLNTVILQSENQPWEDALIREFRSLNSGRVLSLLNCIVSTWDMRFWPVEINAPSREDREYLCDNPINIKVLAQNSSNHIIHSVEPLIKLQNLRPDLVSQKREYILVCGEYNMVRTTSLINYIQKWSLNKDVKVVFRPHPNCIKVIVPSEWILDESSNLIESITGAVSVITTTFTSIPLVCIKLQVKCLCLQDQRWINSSPFCDYDMVKIIKPNEDFMEQLELSANNSYVVNESNVHNNQVNWETLLN
jgi:hypothetical protein